MNSVPPPSFDLHPRFRFYSLVCLLVFLFADPSQAAPSEQAFPPESTWIFMVGILEWEDAETFASFPKENRQDEQVIEFFQRSGVPARQIHHVTDQAATLGKIRRAFSKFIQKIPSDGVLLFYYCGHGYEEEDGAAFAPWDASRAGGWPMQEVVEKLRNEFPGKRALLLADCCHSGALVQAVRKAKGRARNGASLAAVSSSSARESSTGDWTFTESFLDALKGRSWADADKDGQITIGEFATLAREEMAAFQAQHVSSEIPSSWTPSLVLSLVTGDQGGRIGERVQVRAEGEWWKARIQEEKEGKFRVRYVGYFEKDDDWVNAKAVKSLTTPRQYTVGTAVEVKWQGEWWPARVLEEKSGSHLIRYDGYGEEWDEWAPAERLRPPSS